MEKKQKQSVTENLSSGISQHEDAVLKKSMQFFAEELFPYLNIEGKVVSFAPTELVHLELQKLFQDFNFVMEDGTWKHFEFQSTNEGLEGLKRFRVYEALTSYQYKVSVETYVLFSGQIKNPMTEFTEGGNTYRVTPIIMQHKDADRLLENLQQKQQREETITKADLIPLVLCPLMGGQLSQKERINKAFQITKHVTGIERADTDKIEAMLYAMADKFLEAADLEKLKEEIAMTRLGQMIWEDGNAKGKIAGKIEGKIEGKIDTYLEIVRDGILTKKEAALRLHITEEELEELLKENILA